MNNFVSNFNRVTHNSVQNFQVNQQPQQMAKEPYIAQPFMPQTTEQLAKTVGELANLNQQQTVNMIKDLLQMPKNFEQLLSQLVVNPSFSGQKTAITLLASSLNLSQLSSLLQNSSKEALTNLYQMLAHYNQMGMSIKDEQLGNITKLISFISAASSSDSQSLRATMLMYLPWLPLTDPNAFKLEIAMAGGNDGAMSSDFITLLLSTVNYGNLQADVYKTEEDGIKIDLISSETFPLGDLVDLMKEESKKYNININLNLATRNAFNKKGEAETQVCMNVSPGVNPFLLVISNSVIKNVHLIDNKEKLREKRKEMLENGES